MLYDLFHGVIKLSNKFQISLDGVKYLELVFGCYNGPKDRYSGKVFVLHILPRLSVPIILYDVFAIEAVPEKRRSRDN